MDKTFPATYEHGVLRLDTPLGLPEHARVAVSVTPLEGKSPSEASLRTDIADDEFELMLEEFSLSGSKPLPRDFSRSDIYSDHD